MIVVDAYVIAYLLISSERSEAMDRLQQLDSEWAAPKLWLDELLNLLAICERTGALTPEQAVESLEDAIELMDGASYDIPPRTRIDRSPPNRLQCTPPAPTQCGIGRFATPAGNRRFPESARNALEKYLTFNKLWVSLFHQSELAYA